MDLLYPSGIRNAAAWGAVNNPASLCSWLITGSAVVLVAAIGDDQDINPHADVVLPCVEEGTDGDLPADLLGDFSGNAGGRLLAEIQLAARQFPLVAFVAQQQHLTVAGHDALDGDGVQVRLITH